MISQYEPINDPSLIVQWISNGNILKSGSKFQMNHDFGYATLDVLYAFPEDAGVYTCQVSNKQGQILTSSVLQCTAKESIISTTLHEGSFQDCPQSFINVYFWLIHCRINRQNSRT